ncbi:hypothetical protein B296_00016418 [Ensete ventricosum]|uniref:Uncharacterized protein n=1 Tax=Ensete ventricosum TaxID=4639 RepID=A0A426Z0M9_ENSVE|nr:hypothetical protein B296_00016418 [Ensete ventricosum]
MDCPRAILRPRVTQEWVGEGELSKERTQSEVAKALQCSSIPCSHRGRMLVVKWAEEVENAEANSKYQDRVKG